MSERTTIGGTVYEAIGSSSSNLLLKCNGTARILWGGKLIDLIKNGKIASEDSLELIFIIADESEIKADGIYVLTTEESNQFWICKDGNKYDLTQTDLYISASKPLTLTVEQKKQALDNIGLFYNTLEEAQAANIKNGLVYITSTKLLYTIKDGIIEEFNVNSSSVAVNKLEVSDVINGSVKLVLSVANDEYLILADLRISANYSIHVKDSAQVCSENADKTLGYRLYMDGGTSYLDVDEINVRNGLDIINYLEITFSSFISLMELSQLKPLNWYVITDYQNPWILPGSLEEANRPILIRALSENSIYEYGYLFQDHRIRIKYDISYLESISILQTDGTVSNINTRGLITWMRDLFNNEANFDFLDYTDYSGNAMTTLHNLYNTEDGVVSNKSIFPTGSHDNKIFVNKVKGIKLTEDSKIDELASIINFTINSPVYNNNITCDTLVINCSNFHNNNLKIEGLLELNQDFYHNTFDNINNCTIFAEITNSTFRNITDSELGEGVINNVVSYCDLSQNLTSVDYPLLYDSTKQKEIYQVDDLIKIICIPESIFYRGMIVMHSGIEDIPLGWAICDGNEYEWNGVKSQTPNLIDKFIKAVGSTSEIKENINDSLNEAGELVLKEEHLPKHSHPHIAHTHVFEGSGSGSFSDSFTALISAYGTSVKEGDGDSKNTGDDTTSSNVTVSGSVSVSISGTTEASTSTETTKTWENKAIKITPNYYSLIFIMKL